MSTSTTKDTGGVTIERFSDRLAVYLESQSAVESLRDTDMLRYPWPDAYNPMLEYLVHRSEEMAESDGRPAALIWLAVHAWFEGALAALTGAGHAEGDPLEHLIGYGEPEELMSLCGSRTAYCTVSDVASMTATSAEMGAKTPAWPTA